MRRANGLAKIRPLPPLAPAGPRRCRTAALGRRGRLRSLTGGAACGERPWRQPAAKVVERRGVLAFSEQQGDRLVDLDALRALGNQDLAEPASSTASNSIVALSVSISAMTSPEWTSSPSFLSHLARLPSVIVGDSAGIRISIGMILLPSARL